MRLAGRFCPLKTRPPICPFACYAAAQQVCGSGPFCVRCSLLPGCRALPPSPLAKLRAVSFSDGRNDLPTAIRAPPPPRAAHSTPLGLLYLGTHTFFRRAAGSVVAPGFVVSPRPSGAFPKGVCTRLGGFPAPRRKTDGSMAPGRRPEKSPASWLAGFASSGWQRRLSSAAEVRPHS